MTTDVKRSHELVVLELIYHKTTLELRQAWAEWDAKRAEFELRLKNLAWKMDQARAAMDERAVVQ